MTDKDSPQGSADAIALEQAIQSAAEGNGGEPVIIKMTVSGGVDGERFNFDFEGDDRGSIHCSMRCELSGREHPEQMSSVDSDSWQAALRALGTADLAARASTTPIPPDSLVGRIEILADGETRTIIFMADEGQAETAGFTAPAGVLEAAEAIYDLAARQLGSPSVRP